MSPKHVKIKAFTLIELLVVISIISLLIAILLPALSSARKAAEVAKSTSNIRQISVALHFYANDNKTSLPFGRARSAGQLPTASTPDGAYFGGLMYGQNYLPTLNIFFAPGQPKGFFNETYMRSNPAWHQWRYIDYAYNYYGAMPWQTPSTPQPLMLALQGPPPSKHLLLHQAIDPVYAASPNGTASSVTVPFTYNGGILVRSYVDGHAKAVVSTDIGWAATSQSSGVSTANYFQEPWYRIGYSHLWY